MSARRTSPARAAWAVSAALLLGPLAAGCTSSPAGGDATTGGDASGGSPSPAAAPPGGGAGETAAAPSGDTSSDTASDTSPDESPDDTGPTAVATDPPAEDPGDAGTPDDPADVDVVITYSGVEPGTATLEVAGFAAVVEDGGECVLTLSRSGHDDVRVEGAGTPDVRTTACGALSVPVGGLAPGEWTARLAYRSATSSGTSPSQTVEIP
ncbi:hypothetical protein JOD57_001645 [Geodermatophilus bullaregiensis]|uniref:hypothetical protein n=1 Tax=Geodermatophilus bullaregiensis TaxID=1564160 RepID=UPI001956A7C7|nr:hypothetical protein [Geodermatophilus bullaregiensis]MBM7805808.1 hypothetical protein [Geodermatophilus bullaregiensis]